MNLTTLESLPKSLQEAIKTYPELLNLSNPLWRINNLYYIKNAQGEKVQFKMNWAQEILWKELHYCDVILKARQLGITTFFSILLLDKVLWSDNIQAGIIAHTLGDAQDIFADKLKYAFDHLHPALRPYFHAVGDSAKELSFSHGSTIRVGTSLRGSTLQYLHISEFGKICAKYPERAREIITGSLNTVHAGQRIFIESTAEGKEGPFYDICEQARKKTGQNLSPLDFKFFFFPWWKHPEYHLSESATIPQDLKDYFAKLYLQNIKLTEEQKNWYAKKSEIQKENMLQEFPSTPDEAFSASQEGYWYASYLKELYDSGHISNVSHDRALPVHTAWDLGQHDHMAIWFFQINRSDDINIIDFWMKTDCPIAQVALMLKEKKYNYGTHIWPFDADSRDRSGSTFVQQARNFGIQGLVLEQSGFLQGVNLVRTMLSKCWFDKTKCADGLRLLENYKKKWNSSLGGWTSEPVHDESSHCADSFRYLISGINRITGSSGSLEKDYSILRKYWG